MVKLNVHNTSNEHSSTLVNTNLKPSDKSQSSEKNEQSSCLENLGFLSTIPVAVTYHEIITKLSPKALCMLERTSRGFQQLIAPNKETLFRNYLAQTSLQLPKSDLVEYINNHGVISLSQAKEKFLDEVQKLPKGSQLNFSCEFPYELKNTAKLSLGVNLNDKSHNNIIGKKVIFLDDLEGSGNVYVSNLGNVKKKFTYDLNSRSQSEAVDSEMRSFVEGKEFHEILCQKESNSQPKAIFNHLKNVASNLGKSVFRF